MRRATFDKWFKEEFGKRHHWVDEDGYARHDKSFLIRAICGAVGVRVHVETDLLHPRHSRYRVSAERSELYNMIDELEARLARLECPKHDYRSDVCVKCGAPRRKGAK